jgi:hypothetical protein
MRKLGGVRQIAPYDIYSRIGTPNPRFELARLARDAANAVAALEESRDESASDISRRPRNKN